MSEKLKQLCDRIITFAVIFISITIVWQWIEYTCYGHPVPSIEDSAFTVLLAWVWSKNIYLSKELDSVRRIK